MPLKSIGQFHWTSDNPSENTSDEWNSVGQCHWKSIGQHHDDFWGDDFWFCNLWPPKDAAALPAEHHGLHGGQGL